MVNQDIDRQTRLLADRLRANPEAWSRALQYANAVEEHRGMKTLPDVEEDPGNDTDYETGEEWDGESCPGSEVPEEDFDLDSDDE
jgi:hypothetical protein